MVDKALKLVGMVGIRDYEKGLGRPDYDQLTVQDIATMGNTLVAYKDEPLSEAIQRLAVRGINKLPVVTRKAPDIVVGVVRRRNIIKAYNIALVRQARSQFDTDKAQLRHVDHTEFAEFAIPPQGRAVKKTIASLAPDLPHDCVLVSVRRGGETLIPHGDTIIQAGDLINVFVHENDKEQVRQCLAGD